MSIKFSLIVPCFNASKLINNLTKKIVNCKTKPDELIFVNDCSTDGFWELFEELAENNNRNRIFSNSENSGSGISRNRAIDIKKFALKPNKSKFITRY